LWHERDISHSSVERVVAPDATVTLHFMLHRLHGLIDGLVVYPENMQKNLEKTGGLFYSQRVMLALVEKGLSREEAYARVQKNAMRTWAEGIPLLDLLLADPDIGGVLGEEALRAACDPAWYIRHARAVQERVFSRR
ncbi:MAG: adenylosuccinate lyase, partial [Myxococcota bacterium]